ncbi:MAG: tetratricopeptide repeat protein [Prevotella sp.]|nr:tetratricopeptide repeat protein [Prevotella sp.]
MKSGDGYFEDEEFREMLEDYERTVKSGQPVFMDADDLADIADYYQEEGRYDDAQKAVDRALELQPDSVVALNYQIHKALDQGDFEAAEGYLDQIIDRDLPEYTYCRAEIWIAQEEVEKADEYLLQQFKECPQEEFQDFVLDVVNLYTDYGYSEKAMEWMMRAKQDGSDDFKEMMGRTLFGLGKYDDSERIFNELIDRDPFQKRYWNALANTQYMKEDYSASVTSSEYAIAIDPEDAEGLVAKANGLFRLENYEEALDYYRRYSEKEPDDEFGLLHQGTCLINLGQFEEAVCQLLKAEEVSPDDSPYLVEIYQELGFAYSELKMPETALYYIDQTEVLDCDHVDMLVVKGHILLGNGKRKEAENIFKQAVQQSGNSPRTLMRIIVSLYDNHYVEAAYKMFKGFFKYVGSDWNEGYGYMALCCYELKHDQEFLDYLEICCKRNPEEAKLVLSHLFPEGMKPKDYYEYMLKELKK